MAYLIKFLNIDTLFSPSKRLGSLVSMISDTCCKWEAWPHLGVVHHNFSLYRQSLRLYANLEDINNLSCRKLVPVTTCIGTVCPFIASTCGEY